MASHAPQRPGGQAFGQAIGSGIDPRPSQFWRLIGEALLRAGARALVWQQRISERRELVTLDQHMLRDIGLSRSAALAEARKPFWRA